MPDDLLPDEEPDAANAWLTDDEISAEARRFVQRQRNAVGELANASGYPFAPTGDGEYEVNLGQNELAAIEYCVQMLVTSMESKELDSLRLAPPAYSSDQLSLAEMEVNREFAENLEMERQSAISDMMATLDNETLTNDQFEVWVKVINAARLVLGSRTGVGTDRQVTVDNEKSQAAVEAALYDLLTELLGVAAEVLLMEIGEDGEDPNDPRFDAL